jgi:hypothetical protein
VAILNEDAQWIVLLGFIISVSIFFLAIIVNESVIVGQTTAESVLDFPKSDIQGLRGDIMRTIESSSSPGAAITNVNNGRFEVQELYLSRKSALVDIGVVETTNIYNVTIHYNNGVTSYYENMVYRK